MDGVGKKEITIGLTKFVLSVQEVIVSVINKVFRYVDTLL